MQVRRIAWPSARLVTDAKATRRRLAGAGIEFAGLILFRGEDRGRIRLRAPRR